MHMYLEVIMQPKLKLFLIDTSSLEMKLDRFTSYLSNNARITSIIF